MAHNASRPSAAADTHAGRARGGSGSRRGSGSSSTSKSGGPRDVVDLSALDNSGASESGSDGGRSGKLNPEVCKIRDKGGCAVILVVPFGAG